MLANGELVKGPCSQTCRSNARPLLFFISTFSFQGTGKETISDDITDIKEAVKVGQG